MTDSQSSKNPLSNAQTRFLKPGEVLFHEGENSRSMYLLKNGMIRLFKKKGDSQIELATVRSGQIIGELAFLDGLPRSASGEALTTCEMIEVSGTVFQQTLSKMPDWLKILLKTVVGRLRTASNRIRQLEQASVSYDDKSQASYIYCSTPDILKTLAGLVLVACRTRLSKPQSSEVIEISMSQLQKYAHEMFGIPISKIMSICEVLTKVQIMKGEEQDKKELLDLGFLEKFLNYLNEENLTEPSKRHDLSHRGLVIMSLIAKHLSKYPKNDDGYSKVNLQEVLLLESKEKSAPFRLDEFPELVNLGYSKNLAILSSKEAIAELKPDEFMLSYRYQKVVKAFEAMNEEKKSKS